MKVAPIQRLVVEGVIDCGVMRRSENEPSLCDGTLVLRFAMVNVWSKLKSVEAVASRTVKHTCPIVAQVWFIIGHSKPGIKKFKLVVRLAKAGMPTSE